MPAADEWSWAIPEATSGASALLSLHGSVVGIDEITLPTTVFCSSVDSETSVPRDRFFLLKYEEIRTGVLAPLCCIACTLPVLVHSVTTGMMAIPV